MSETVAWLAQDNDLPGEPATFEEREHVGRRNRLLYCNWLAENRRSDKERLVETEPEPFIDFESLEAFDPDELDSLILKRQGDERAERIGAAVQAAVIRLTEDEREFLARFYHMGETYRCISEKSGRSIHSLESLHQRAKRKLRKYLASFASGEFGIVTRTGENCVICHSGYREEIDTLIADHRPQDTWRNELRIMKTQFGLTGVTPQTIIGHRNYH